MRFALPGHTGRRRRPSEEEEAGRRIDQGPERNSGHNDREQALAIAFATFHGDTRQLVLAKLLPAIVLVPERNDQNSPQIVLFLALWMLNPGGHNSSHTQIMANFP